ncbi:MAG: response regulator [Deltaproteobacteria bacterium]
MPKMSGIEATKLIKREKTGICVIALSIADDEGTANAMYAAGANAFFRKSDPPDELVSMIRQKCS